MGADWNPGQWSLDTCLTLAISLGTILAYAYVIIKARKRRRPDDLGLGPDWCAIGIEYYMVTTSILIAAGMAVVIGRGNTTAPGWYILAKFIAMTGVLALPLVVHLDETLPVRYLRSRQDDYDNIVKMEDHLVNKS